MYWQAWNALRDDRHYGDMGGIGRIYYTAIKAYADANNITGYVFSIMIRLIWDMDQVYIDHIAEKQKAEAEKHKKEKPT